jgi:hypothetical protein
MVPVTFMWRNSLIMSQGMHSRMHD